MAKVTSFDVAQLAGVSQPTVSRALRNLPGTSAQTRARVRRAAEELSYVTSDRGRSLSTSSTSRIAVVSEELTNPYYPELVEPLRVALARSGFQVVLVTEPPADGDFPGALADGSYDGVLMTTTARRSSLPRDLTELGVPHVLVNRLLDEPESPSCAVDNWAGAELVAKLLLGLGHHHIASIQGPVETSTGALRADGFRKALARGGVRLPRNVTLRSPFSHEGGRQAACELLSLPEPPTAIFSGNDVIALGVLSAARELGVAVPERLTVVGFDDIAMAGWPIVNLTTVRVDLVALAELAVQLLLAQLRGDSRTTGAALLTPSLVLRGTHAPVSE